MPVFLDERLAFPDPRAADPSGLVAVGGDLSVERLLLAYRSGIFPWSAQPITWWSPDPRGIFELDRFHVSRSLGKLVKRCRFLPAGESLGSEEETLFDVTVNRSFREVVENCATARTDGNWISAPFIDAYTKVHSAGHAHSIECWHRGELAGGIYGVALGGLFAGESMFHRVSNASKVALYFLIEHLRHRGFTLFDIQMITETTRQFGAIELSRDEYLRRLEKAVNRPVTFTE